MKPLLSTLLAAAVLAGCGITIGEDEEPATPPADPGAETTPEPTTADTETFAVPGFDISFEYPADFELTEDVTFSETAGVSAAESAAVAIDGSNLIGVQLFELGTEVTEANFGTFQRSLDDAFSRIAGRPVTGERIDVGGLPALQYELALTEPPGGVTRAVAIVDGSDEYLLNCQSTDEFRDRIEAACDLALETFSTR